MNQIKGVIPAMMTFFDREENVDTECTRRMGGIHAGAWR